MQTTAIDQGAGIVNLTTVLAHSSGEWIASDWPVCALSETATPHRMGAALTYARRYALFTLVGIAGEDDLDAPDLQTPTSQAVEPPRQPGRGNGRLNGGARPSRDRKAYPTASKPILGSVQSAELRERLLAELSRLASGEDAAIWAHRSLPEKNRLTAADAQTRRAGLPGKDGGLHDQCRRIRPKPGSGRAASSRHSSTRPIYHEQPAEAFTSEADRQKRPRPPRAAPDPGPRSRPIRGQAALPDLRPAAV